ncbi:MAG: sugar kinase [Clostridia bacterium]|jgi:2-dehydro-3-deoxygluconokinase|nr:sugar kinase [Clostridia bacterium]MBO7548980.1 sugar kinase [Clostridia bacterium]MBP5237730.1 sugar kinase [Clostridia bacterium]MBP5657403.1 sugar kinase [Clostridia bacterium]
MELKQNAKWSLVVPTSMGVRITPQNRQPVQASDTFFMQATSAETNVASVASYLGENVKVLTAFVKDSPVAAFIKQNLRSRGMTYEAKETEQGGPWGYRHQFNIADSGCGARGPRVHNDRAGEVGRILCAADFDTDRIFGVEGVKILHLSGLIAALSPQTGELCVHLAKAAKKYGTLVSFDLNYRESFWQGRRAELEKAFRTIAENADILVGNEEDFQLCFGINGPEAGGRDIEAKMDSFRALIDEAQREFPNASVFATTLREVISAEKHLWGAILKADGKWYSAPARQIDVLDRIGGGDGFVGGLLYGVMKGWDMEKCLQFGWSCGALAVTMLTDYAQPADEDQVWSIWKGNARVKR